MKYGDFILNDASYFGLQAGEYLFMGLTFNLIVW